MKSWSLTASRTEWNGSATDHHPSKKSPGQEHQEQGEGMAEKGQQRVTHLVNELGAVVDLASDGEEEAVLGAVVGQVGDGEGLDLGHFVKRL